MIALVAVFGLRTLFFGLLALIIFGLVTLFVAIPGRNVIYALLGLGLSAPPPAS